MSEIVQYEFKILFKLMAGNQQHLTADQLSKFLQIPNLLAQNLSKLMSKLDGLQQYYLNEASFIKGLSQIVSSSNHLPIWQEEIYEREDLHRVLFLELHRHLDQEKSEQRFAYMMQLQQKRMERFYTLDQIWYFIADQVYSKLKFQIQLFFQIEPIDFVGFGVKMAEAQKLLQVNSLKEQNLGVCNMIDCLKVVLFQDDQSEEREILLQYIYKNIQGKDLLTLVNQLFLASSEDRYLIEINCLTFYCLLEQTSKYIPSNQQILNTELVLEKISQIALEGKETVVVRDLFVDLKGQILCFREEPDDKKPSFLPESVELREEPDDEPEHAKLEHGLPVHAAAWEFGVLPLGGFRVCPGHVLHQSRGVQVRGGEPEPVDAAGGGLHPLQHIEIVIQIQCRVYTYLEFVQKQEVLSLLVEIYSNPIHQKLKQYALLAMKGLLKQEQCQQLYGYYQKLNFTQDCQFSDMIYIIYDYIHALVQKDIFLDKQVQNILLFNSQEDNLIKQAHSYLYLSRSIKIKTLKAMSHSFNDNIQILLKEPCLNMILNWLQQTSLQDELINSIYQVNLAYNDFEKIKDLAEILYQILFMVAQNKTTLLGSQFQLNDALQSLNTAIDNLFIDQADYDKMFFQQRTQIFHENRQLLVFEVLHQSMDMIQSYLKSQQAKRVSQNLLGIGSARLMECFEQVELYQKISEKQEIEFYIQVEESSLTMHMWQLKGVSLNQLKSLISQYIQIENFSIEKTDSKEEIKTQRQFESYISQNVRIGSRVNLVVSENSSILQQCFNCGVRFYFSEQTYVCQNCGGKKQRKSLERSSRIRNSAQRQRDSNSNLVYPNWSERKEYPANFDSLLRSPLEKKYDQFRQSILE